LPFAYDSNGTGTASIAGFSQSGLSNYSSAPKIKFDNEGDYLILAFGEAPGILTYDIKGNSFSGGTFKVQSSTDGQTYTDVKTYTTLDNDNKQSEIINNLSSDVRFIKWVYTSKSSGNVALGNISLAKLSAGISLSNYTINVPAAGVENIATLDVVYTLVDFTTNPEIIWCDANGNQASSTSWFDAYIDGTTHNVMYIASANTGAARSTYFKIYGLDSSANDVFSSVITVNQAAASYATLPFAFDGGRSDIASKAGLTFTGLGSDYNSSPCLKFDETGSSLILQVNEAIDILSFDIKGNSYSSSSIFKVQTSVDGTNYTDLKTYTELDATQTEVLTNLSSDVRYIKWIYSNKASGNVALGNIKAAKITQLTGTLNEGRYWTTFFNGSCRYTLSEGAHAFTMNASHQLYQLGTDGSVIPANTPVIIISDTANIALTQSSDTTAVTVNGETNILSGSDSSVAVSGITGTPYVMGIVGGVLGFYQFNGTEVPAAKAYISE